MKTDKKLESNAKKIYPVKNTKKMNREPWNEQEEKRWLKKQQRMTQKYKKKWTLKAKAEKKI